MSFHHPRRQQGNISFIASSSPSTHSIPLSFIVYSLIPLPPEGEAPLLLPAQPSPPVAAPNEVKAMVVAAAILTLFISVFTYCKLVSDMIQIYGSQMVETGLCAAVVLLIITAIAVQIARRW
ncbi:hypothetical protein Scep_008276 [Stephania cephalantha]|uniref:Uncharacterized protein n=1 Tax=Stephania cephalantha TaxID=152367 RepID=A0AAP0KDG5_9MAGN